MLRIEIPDVFDESFDEVCQHLMALCRRLEALLPDPTLSPEERLERLGRVAPQSELRSDCHKTARTKLTGLRIRLAQLVPSPQLTDMEKLEFLVKRTNELVPDEMPRFFMKLEKLGDQRDSDIGR